MRLLIRESYALVSARPDTACNFVPGRSLTYYRGKGDVKLVYRHYATLYFIFVVDAQESELGILDLIQVFVESLDRCFEAVCELDLIFNSEKVSCKLSALDRNSSCFCHVFVAAVLGVSFLTATTLTPLADFVTHYKQVHYCLDEIIMGGMVLETNIGNVLQGVMEMDKLERTNANSRDAHVIGSPR